MKLHVTLGKLFEHVLRFRGNVELSLEVLNFGLCFLKLDGHVVKVGCRGRRSA